MAYSRLFSSDDGRKVLEDIERGCGSTRCSVRFTGDGSVDFGSTVFTEGKRDVALGIRRMIEIGKSPEVYWKKFNENEEQEAES